MNSEYIYEGQDRPVIQCLLWAEKPSVACDKSHTVSEAVASLGKERWGAG